MRYGRPQKILQIERFIHSEVLLILQINSGNRSKSHANLIRTAVPSGKRSTLHEVFLSFVDDFGLCSLGFFQHMANLCGRIIKYFHVKGTLNGTARFWSEIYVKD
jgi:hypothetical protein